MVYPLEGRLVSEQGETRVQPKSMDVLLCLAEGGGAVVQREDILRRVWGERAPSDEPLTRCIGELRRALGDARSEPQYVLTIPKRGYRLLQEAVPLEGERETIVEPASFDDDIPAIAVLPFLDLSPEQDHEYFSDGLSEELLNLLVKIPNLRVVARTSSFSFKNQSVDIATVAHKLKVNHVLEGSVRFAGAKMRITAQLIDARNGYHLWSRTYDRTLDDVFAVQDEIAATVVDSLKVALLGSAIPRATKTDPEAYALYLQASYFQNRKDRDSLEKAVATFRQVLERDPGYAQAWNGLAAAYIGQTNLGIYRRDEGIAMAKEARVRALDLDDSLADAHAGMAHIQMFYDRDLTGAHASIEKALQREPKNAKAVLRAGSLAAILGRFDEGIALAQEAVTLDPLRIASHNNLGLALTAANRQDEAIAAFRRMLDLNPRTPMANFLIAQALLLSANPQAALEAVEQESDEGWNAHGMALTLHTLGKQDEADRALDHLVELFHQDMACQIANTYAWRNEADNAFEWFERAYDQNDGGLSEIRRVPLLDNIHDDARWPVLLERVGLSDARIAGLPALNFEPRRA